MAEPRNFFVLLKAGPACSYSRTCLDGADPFQCFEKVFVKSIMSWVLCRAMIGPAGNGAVRTIGGTSLSGMTGNTLTTLR